MHKSNKRIIHTLVVMSMLFLSIIGYMTYFEVFMKDKIISNSYNRRQLEQEENAIRGSVFDRNGTVLAESQVEGEKQQRIYPYKNLYSHIIGYSSKVYGKSLIEASYNKYLLGINELNAVFDIKNKLTGGAKKGNHVHLTIDHQLQVRAEKLLRSKKGAVVVVNPKTGEILAMVSKPDFNPTNENLEKKWREMVESKEYPFLPRATQGLYIPGSTYKIVNSAAAIEQGLGDFTIEDEGSIVIDGKEIKNSGSKAHGLINMKQALAVSSNTFFSQIGVKLGTEHLKSTALKVGFGKDIPFDIPMNQSIFPYNDMSETDMAAVGMGQGKLLVTPLHMAMITSSVANEGIMMKPFLVSEVTTVGGSVISNHKPERLCQTMMPETANKVKEMMREVVETGTGKNAGIKGINVAGKTGTAENELTGKEKNKEHAWFVGFAPVEDPQVAVAVIIEYGGSTGGQTAAPIARELMAAWLAK
ncbi:penicillin-binding transpeptidase domain-containing protein [Petroclostridium sp. X23]|uniref:peptidoglycan D,D-transpeptidase FtsI family protein n=1 Tax=Petroclostridium sp. X23 TaxID=3045146 RepID=UPI0024ACEC05|nr:penicillin-binding transpeptidase domain-containing protein [Petroclostridium sp. X23]WHH59355.1 penicillin-binding transpeptidase domain-containing protein [Petroclostridium sp. X23]